MQLSPFRAWRRCRLAALCALGRRKGSPRAECQPSTTASCFLPSSTCPAMPALHAIVPARIRLCDLPAERSVQIGRWNLRSLAIDSAGLAPQHGSVCGTVCSALQESIAPCTRSSRLDDRCSRRRLRCSAAVRGRESASGLSQPFRHARARALVVPAAIAIQFVFVTDNLCLPLPARLAIVASCRLCITTSGDDLCPYLQSRRVGPRTTPAAMMNDRTRRFGKDPRVSESTVPGAGDCRHTAGMSRTRCAGRPSPGPGEDARVVCASARLRVCASACVAHSVP
ncbi:hypothetical protein L1887_43430 [Cichorium endivia]|nr:hypothetical protein L1887_43430 [Cichorium endivia]